MSARPYGRVPRGTIHVTPQQLACERQYCEGSTRPELARLYGVSVSMIGKWLDTVRDWKRDEASR